MMMARGKFPFTLHRYHTQIIVTLLEWFSPNEIILMNHKNYKKWIIKYSNQITTMAQPPWRTCMTTAACRRVMPHVNAASCPSPQRSGCSGLRRHSSSARLLKKTRREVRPKPMASALLASTNTRARHVVRHLITRFELTSSFAIFHARAVRLQKDSCRHGNGTADKDKKQYNALKKKNCFLNVYVPCSCGRRAFWETHAQYPSQRQ